MIKIDELKIISAPMIERTDGVVCEIVNSKRRAKINCRKSQ